MTTFENLGLIPRLVNELNKQNITKPTPIQIRAIPAALEGKDVMGLAQTGTGKTAAFGLPLIQTLIGAGTKPIPKSVRGLILAPTRELAKQIVDNLSAYAADTHLRISMVVGGVGIVPQIKRLGRGTDLLVATPGRLIDLLDRKAVRLDQTEYLVLDEADQMLDMGFIHALRRIATLLPRERQTMLFSATMPKQMAELSKSYLRNPVRVEVSAPGKPVEKITQKLFFVEQTAKADLLRKLLAEHPDELSLIFSRTKHGAERMKKALNAAGFVAESIHGNKSQGQRVRALEAFKAGEAKILVATDVAARGLDIPEVRFVYNYDMPNVADNYVHRIGRTARAGRDGSAVAFVSASEMSELRAVEKVMGIKIPIAGGEVWEFEEPKPKRGGGGGGGGKGRSKPKKKTGPKPAQAASEGGSDGQAKPARRRRSRKRRSGAKTKSRKPLT